MLQKIKEFLKEVKVELKKVSWPSRKEAIASTLVVVVVTMSVGAFVGLTDFIFNKLFEIILK